MAHACLGAQGILNILGKATPPPVAPAVSGTHSSTPPPTSTTGPNSIIDVIEIDEHDANTCRLPTYYYYLTSTYISLHMLSSTITIKMCLQAGP